MDLPASAGPPTGAQVPSPSGKATVQAQSLRLDGVSKSFGGVQAVKPLSLEILPGELVALLGPSGCGKTTTLRMVAGFEIPDSGTIHIGARDVTTLSPHKRRIGMVFQSYALFPHMTVGQNIAFGLRMQRMRGAEQRRRVTEILATVRLAGYEDRFGHQLSGGQQQRVALARSIVTNPQVLLLDEPLGALDKNLREGMQFELHQLQKSLMITSVLVTHDQEEALTMADRVAVMADGRILQIGTPTEIYERPRTRFVAEFLGTANIFPAEVLARPSPDLAVLRIRLGEAEQILPVPTASCAVGDEVQVAVRPEKMFLNAERRRRQGHRARSRLPRQLSRLRTGHAGRRQENRRPPADHRKRFRGIARAGCHGRAFLASARHHPARP